MDCRLGLLGSSICCGRLRLLLRLALRIALGIALALRHRRLLLRTIGLTLLRPLALRLPRRNLDLRILVLRRGLLGCSLGMGTAAPTMATAARLARSTLPRLFNRRLLALGLHIGRSLLINRLLFTNFRLGRLHGLLGPHLRNLINLLLALYGVRATCKAATGTTRV